MNALARVFRMTWENCLQVETVHNQTFSIPLLLVGLLVICSLGTAVLLLIAGLLFNMRYRLVGPNFG